MVRYLLAGLMMSLLAGLALGAGPSSQPAAASKDRALADQVRKPDGSPAAATQPAVDCYISSGDNYWMGEWLPFDSPAAVNASVDMLKDTLNVRRIYWRGLQDALLLPDGVKVRKEACRYVSYWDYTCQLYKSLSPDVTVVKAAHRRGMEVWGVGSLFDWGGPADTACFGGYPFWAESKLRVDHPEWIPVDRHGFRRQPGPIELAYPEARKVLVDLFVREVLRAGYDGMALMTYIENYGLRFEDEFGFNDPIVQKVQDRFRFNLRKDAFTKSFSRVDWYMARGEYVTQFLRELKAELSKHGKKLAVFVNSTEPRYPQPWNVPEYVLTAGRIYMDLETWVRDGIVDQFILSGGNNGPVQVKALEDCLWLARDSRTNVTVVTSSPFNWKEYRRSGVVPITSLGGDADYLERSLLSSQPLGVLKEQDAQSRMKLLSQVVLGTTQATAADLSPAAADPNLLVRRLALLALGKTKDSKAVPILEQGLADDENSVRCMAAISLRDINRPESTGKLLIAVEKFGNHPLNEIVFQTLARISPSPLAELTTAVGDSKSTHVRTVALRALAILGSHETVSLFTQCLSDGDLFMQMIAAQGLGNISNSEAAVNALIAATSQPDVVASTRSAEALGNMAARGDKAVVGGRAQVVAAVGKLFSKYGDECTRADRDWGYRPVGNALVDLGPDGVAILKAAMSQSKDKRLAELAWMVLALPQRDARFMPATENEDSRAFSRRPR